MTKTEEVLNQKIDWQSRRIAEMGSQLEAAIEALKQYVAHDLDCITVEHPSLEDTKCDCRFKLTCEVLASSHSPVFEKERAFIEAAIAFLPTGISAEKLRTAPSHLRNNALANAIETRDALIQARAEEKA